MADRRDDFETVMARRLRDAEERVVGAEPPAVESMPAQRSRWPAVAGVVAAAVLLGVVLGRSLLDLPVADTSPRPSASEATTAEPSAPATPPDAPSATPEPTDTGIPFIAWEPTTAVDGEVNDIIWFDGRFVAVGGADGAAAAWSLAPGGTWQAAATIDPPAVPFDPEAGEPGQRFWMSTVVELDGELVAIGWEGNGCCDAGQAAIWTSGDGIDWTYHDPSGTPFGTAYHVPIEAAVTTDGEIVLLSSVDLSGSSTIWISTDGRTWVEHPPNLGEAEVLDRLAAGDGRLLATGQGPGDAGRATMLWTSSDGRSWTEAGLPEGADHLGAVAWDAARGVFVVGGDGPAGIQSWLTSDGHAWSPAQVLTGVSGTVHAISSRNGLTVVVGVTGESTETRVHAWRISIGDDVAPQESILSQGLPFEAPFRLEMGDGAGLVHGAVIEVAGASPVPRAWYGVPAVP